MPELPDLVYIQRFLHGSLPGRRIVSVEICDPIVVRCLLAVPFEQALSGRQFKSVHRHGPFLVFELCADLQLVVHPMLAGKFRLDPAAEPGGRRALSLKLGLQDNSALCYLDDKRMGKVYLTRHHETGQIPKFDNQGIDILSAGFTEAAFLDLIAGQRKQVRVFLMDQSLLSAIGNAYADEVLFDAGIHPKTFCYQLSDNERRNLFRSVGKVMSWGIAAVAKAGSPIDVKVRDHMKVRNRRNLPCLVCGTTIRRAGVLGHDTFFCPVCQRAKRDQFIPWDKS